MGKRGRIVLTALALWILLAFVPIMNTGPKVGWIQVWAAYLIFAGTMMAGEWSYMFLMSALVIVLHLLVPTFIAVLVFNGGVKKTNEER